MTGAARPLTLNYSPQDHLVASALHWRGSFFGVKFARVVAIFSILAGAVYSGIAYIDNIPTTELIRVFVFSVLGTAIFIFVLALLKRAIYLPRIARRSFAQMKEYHEPWTYTAEQDRLILQNSRGTASLPYSDFVKWNANTKTFLVYRSDNSYNVIPRQFMPDHVKAELIAHLQAAAVPRSGFWNC